MRLPNGIISVVQTPFLPDRTIDFDSLQRLIVDALDAQVDGFLVPAVASEVQWLTDEERGEILRSVLQVTENRVPIIAGASAAHPETVQTLGAQAEAVGADAWLIAVPQNLYSHSDEILPYFLSATHGVTLPLVIQDLQFQGPGLSLKTMQKLQSALPTLAGWKIETVPAGPKYTAAREAFGPSCHISGGWAVPQFIEALDRGINAMIPESAMIRVYKQIDRLFHNGNRTSAQQLLHRLLPVLTFTNQEILTSIAFFKRLLCRKGIFAHPTLRAPGFEWDHWNLRIADELIDLYLSLERDLQSPS